MRVLVACEFSGVVRSAFRERGHDAWSCDLDPADDGSLHHYQEDCIKVLQREHWDMMIAHPPCTYLASSGLHWEKRLPNRIFLRKEAFDFIFKLVNHGPAKWCIENPVGAMSTMWRKPDQYIQPWQFGHDASKRTCLWLKDLPPLRPTAIIIKKQYANQTPSGQNKLGPSLYRGRIRSITYQGIARAMADQWG